MGYVQVRAVPIVDYSSEYEFSNDQNMNFTMDDNKRGVNHLVCLGKGELKDRLVIHLYVDEKGNVGQTQYYRGIDEIEETYPVTNISVNSKQLDGYTVFNYPISMANGWNYVKQQLGDTRDYIYDMDAKAQDIDIQSAEAYVNSEYAVALAELEVM